MSLHTVCLVQVALYVVELLQVCTGADRGPHGIVMASFLWLFIPHSFSLPLPQLSHILAIATRNTGHTGRMKNEESQKRIELDRRGLDLSHHIPVAAQLHRATWTRGVLYAETCFCMVKGCLIFTYKYHYWIIILIRDCQISKCERL